MNKFFTIALVLFFGFNFTVPNLFAQESSFTLKPGKLETEIQAGEEKTLFLAVTNNLGADYDFKLMVEDVSFKEGEGLIFHQDNLGPYSLKNYISFEQDVFTILNEQTVELAIKVSLPENTPPGSRHAVVLISPIFTPSGGEAFVSSEIGSLVFVKIAGEVVESGELASFKVLDNFIFNDEALAFNVAFNNTGNTYLNPYGVIKIKGLWGKETIVPIDPWFVLPNSIRSRDILGELLASGFYQAEINLNRGYDDVVDKETVSFWVINWGVLISAGIFVLTLFLALLVMLKFKRR